MLLHELCDKRIRGLSEEDLDTVFAAVKCDQLDQDMLKEFRIDDCPALFQPTLVEVESIFCDYEVDMLSWEAIGSPWVDVEDNCGLRNEDDGSTEKAAIADACKPAMEAAVKKWEPHEVDSMTQKDKVQQVHSMAMAMACKSMKYVEYSEPWGKDLCHDVEDELKDFGYDVAACLKYYADKTQFMHEAVCFMVLADKMHEKGLEPAERFTFEELKDAVDETKAELDQSGFLESKASIDPRAAQRLLASIGARRWSPGSAAALSAAAALALAAVGGVAWRLHRGRPSPSSASAMAMAMAGDHEETTGTEQLVS